MTILDCPTEITTYTVIEPAGGFRVWWGTDKLTMLKTLIYQLYCTF